MNKWMTLGIGVLVIAIIAGIVLIVLPPPVKAPTTQHTQDQGNAAELADTIKATIPAPGNAISSPLTIVGQARGTWYFEASFPYELRDQSGTVIAQGPVQAQGDWMTEDFVPFSQTVTFPAQPAGSSGTLLLKKDNPSGDPARDQALTIPVVFK